MCTFACGIFKAELDWLAQVGEISDTFLNGNL